VHHSKLALHGDLHLPIPHIGCVDRSHVPLNVTVLQTMNVYKQLYFIMCRAISDGAFTAQITDLVVHPQWQVISDSLCETQGVCSGSHSHQSLFPPRQAQHNHLGRVLDTCRWLVGQSANAALWVAALCREGDRVIKEVKNPVQ